MKLPMVVLFAGIVLLGVYFPPGCDCGDIVEYARSAAAGDNEDRKWP